jgi:hypothetical protein
VTLDFRDDVFVIALSAAELAVGDHRPGGLAVGEPPAAERDGAIAAADLESRSSGR